MLNTPGPWEEHLFTVRKGDTIIADVCAKQLSGERPPKEYPANAVLIAAAPELLHACQSAISLLDARSLTRAKWTTKDQTTYELLRAAINKATKEPSC